MFKSGCAAIGVSKADTLCVLIVSAMALVMGLPPVCCYAGDAGTAPQGKILVDTGFRPKPSGFGFENWGGNEHPLSDLTADDARALFGDRVCARFEKGVCVPTPAAKLWLAEMNQMKKGGHCEGMAAMSAAFHVKKESSNDYGAAQPFELQPKKTELMRTISAYFATQALEPVNAATSATREWSLQKIVDQLVAALGSKTDYVTLGIYGAAGGHAITPYMVEELGPGVYRIHVYDNNYPGVAKHVDVDVPKDRWVYAGAALNPSEDPAPWEGGQGSMDITLLSTRYEPLQCPFCGDHRPPKGPQQSPVPSTPRKPSIDSDGYTVLTPARCSQVQATRKADKKQLSGARNGAKNEISGATMRPMRGSKGCVVRLPRDQEYDVLLVNDGISAPGAATGVTIFYPGNVYSVSNVVLVANANQTFSLSKDNFAYVAGGSQQPTLRITGDRAGSNTLYEVTGFTLHDGKSFGATEGDDGRITLHDDDAQLDQCDISAEVVSESETEVHDLDDVDFGEKGQLILHGEDDGGLDVDVDSDSDGTSDAVDADDDNDGTPDAKDTDDDNDGEPDAKEALDSDGDSVPDAKDSDDDNDGEPDAADKDGLSLNDDEVDSDHDGVADDADADDDNDGTPDAADTDDDNDATSDDDADSDHDGVADDADADDDNDGTPDAADADDDNDGVSDVQESESDDPGDDDQGGDDADADDGSDADSEGGSEADDSGGDDAEESDEDQ
jgi:hypothetical protein